MRRGMRGRPMPRRTGRPGLIGTAARTAVVAGTATAVVGGVHHHQEQKSAAQQAEADQQQLDAQQQQPEPPTVPQQAAPPAEPDRIAKIKELGQMRDQGLLTDQEFAAEKARVLAT